MTIDKSSASSRVESLSSIRDEILRRAQEAAPNTQSNSDGTQEVEVSVAWPGEDIVPDWDRADKRMREARELVRYRPAMFLGDTDLTGLNCLFVSVLEDAVNEALAGRLTSVDVALYSDGSVSVADDGVGFSSAINEPTGLSQIELRLRAFDRASVSLAERYVVPSLFGIGSHACVNFLSAWCDFHSEHKGNRYSLRCEEGVPIAPLKELGATTGHGTMIRWLPDPQIFGDHRYSADILRSYIRKICYLTPEITIRFEDRSSDGEPEEYHFERGVADLLAELNISRESISDIVHARESRDGVHVDLALQFTTSGIDTSHTFANNVHTPAGGSHLDGLKLGVRRALGKFARGNGLLPSGAKFANVDITYGLTAVISIRHFHPQFEGATKAKLHNPETVGPISQIVEDALMRHFEQYPDVAAIVLKRSMRTRQVRLRL